MDEQSGRLEFLEEVTSDLLARGIFSERGLCSALDSAVRDRRSKVRFFPLLQESRRLILSLILIFR